MEGVVKKTVQTKLDYMLKKYDKVAKGFKKFFNGDEMFRVLAEAINQK